MASRPREFVAEELWLLIAVVTLPLAALAAFAGLGGLMMTITAVGWFLLTPLFMFWGDDVAAWLFDESESTAETEPVDELKRRYAEGEIGDEEFERQLDRLMESDAGPGDASDLDAVESGPGDADRSSRGGTAADPATEEE